MDNDKEEETSIWADILNHINKHNEAPLEVYKQFVMLVHTLQVDCVHKKVITTLKNVIGRSMIWILKKLWTKLFKKENI